MKFINKYRSPNFNYRIKGSSIKFVILHYTAISDCNEALEFLCDKKNRVSTHFLIDKSGKIFNLVDLNYRAWHAGKSEWLLIKDINSESIGIELDNSGHHISFENYESSQIKSLIKLLEFIKKKYKISEKNILGHSDIAPYRKIDPGEKFPWNVLEEKNLSYLPKKLSKKQVHQLESRLNLIFFKKNKEKSLHMLSSIGYDTKLANNSILNYQALIKAFQMHFRQKLVTGVLDEQTYGIILSYYNEMLT